MRRTRATYLWALVVLPLLAGLFAMHGVQAATGEGHAMPMIAPAHAMPAHAMPEAVPSEAHGHDGMAMCLGLLVLTLLALALTRAPWPAGVRDAFRAVRPPRADRLRPPRGPPVYLRLCVFRL